MIGLTIFFIIAFHWDGVLLSNSSIYVWNEYMLLKMTRPSHFVEHIFDLKCLDKVWEHAYNGEMIQPILRINILFYYFIIK
jgi:hypothetical protein